MNLKNFESEVEQKIVGRGLSYYKGGDVKKLEKVSENEFSRSFSELKNTVFMSN
jgi:hypothetical protein